MKAVKTVVLVLMLLHHIGLVLVLSHSPAAVNIASVRDSWDRLIKG